MGRPFSFLNLDHLSFNQSGAVAARNGPVQSAKPSSRGAQMNLHLTEFQ
jgi:hypothetical protein